MFEPPYTRTRAANERLRAHECDACGWVSFPEQPQFCKRCGVDASWSETRLQPRGTVRSYVVQQRLPEEFETPLPLAVMDMPQEESGEPARVYGLFTEINPANIEIGMEAEGVFRRVFDVAGLPIHSFKFTRPRGDRL